MEQLDRGSTNSSDVRQESCLRHRWFFFCPDVLAPDASVYKTKLERRWNASASCIAPPPQVPSAPSPCSPRVHALLSRTQTESLPRSSSSFATAGYLRIDRFLGLFCHPRPRMSCRLAVSNRQHLVKIASLIRSRMMHGMWTALPAA